MIFREVQGKWCKHQLTIHLLGINVLQVVNVYGFKRSMFHDHSRVFDVLIQIICKIWKEKENLNHIVLKIIKKCTHQPIFKVKHKSKTSINQPINTCHRYTFNVKIHKRLSAHQSCWKQHKNLVYANLVHSFHFCFIRK